MMEKIKGNELIDSFMGVSPKIEYSISNGEGYCYSPANMPEYFPDASSQKRECERWLKEQHEKYPKGWVTTGGYEVTKEVYHTPYDKHWNQLMPVVEKIIEIDITPAPNWTGYRIEIVPRGYVKISGFPMPTILKNVSIEGSLREAVWQAVTEFLIWLNNKS